VPSELLLEAPHVLRLSPYNDPPLEPGTVRADAIVSGISHGTELALYRGASAFGHRRFDPELRLFVEEPTTATCPMRLGYEWVGRVREVGPEVQAAAVGDLVQCALPHRETQTFPAAASSPPWTVLPATLAPERATFLQSATIALQAVHDAAIKAGDRVAVFGLGTFGLLAVQLAVLSGAGWIAAVDPVEARRALASAAGADLTLDPASADAGYELKLATRRAGVDVAIEFSGRYAALHQALRSVRLAGTVVAAGFYVGPVGDDFSLGEEFHHNRLTLVGSMSGWNAPHRVPGWDRPRLRATALDLLARDRLDVDAFVTHRIPFARAPEAYELIDGSAEEVLRVLLTY
jgi:2-desacetyl-2-hydroxyethyl bacteriochlorophyllide A dehydrogenase